MQTPSVNKWYQLSEHRAGELPHDRQRVGRVHALQLACTQRPVCCMHLQAAGTTSF